MTSEQIKQARKTLGLTQVAFSNLLGIKLDKLKTWESGRYGISDEGATAIRWLLDGKLPDTKKPRI